MSEQENKVEGQVEEPVNSVEQEASAKGWKPKEEAVAAGMNPDDAVDAQTFLDRTPFIKRIKLLDQRNNTLTRKMDQILQKFDQAETQGYERAIEELTAQRDEAYDSLDSQSVRELDQQIDAQKRALDDSKVRQQQNQTAEPEALDFVEHNKEWWNKDQAAMQFAVATEAALKSSHPNMALTEIYEEVQKRVDVFRGQSPSTNTTTETPKASFVAPPGRGGSASSAGKTYGFNDLTSEAKDVYMSMKSYRQDEFGEDYKVADFVKSQIDTGAVELKELIR